VTVASGLTEPAAKESAEAYRQIRKTDVLREGLTLSQFGLGFLDRRERAGIRAIKEDRNRWSRYIDRDPIGGMVLATLGRRDVLDWLDRRTGLAHQTRKNALNLLRVALQEAFDREVTSSNVARDVRVHRASSAKETDDLEGILVPDEQRRLLTVVPEAERPVVEFALYSGVRQGSQWWLKSADCHGDSAFIRRHKNGRPRTLHLLGPAQTALATALERGSTWAFPAPRGGRRQKGNLPGREARGEQPSDWQVWLAAAGINRRVRWHDLRHTCATSLLAGWWGDRKWSLDEVCDYMGHSSVKVTERYARKLQETQRKAVAETVFPGGNRGGNQGNDNCSGLPASASPCKTVIRGFESRPHLRSETAAVPIGESSGWEHAGNEASPAAWALALAADRSLSHRVVAVKAVRRRRRKGVA
jgi:integrase